MFFLEPDNFRYEIFFFIVPQMKMAEGVGVGYKLDNKEDTSGKRKSFLHFFQKERIITMF